MVLFLASVLEQLDLALEHVSKRDVHNARFGLMLVDNAVELVLHQIALDQSSKLHMFGHMPEDYPHQSALNKALGKDFEAKVKFARTEGHLNEKLSRTINIMHGFRNEVYHVGIKHEAILPSLSSFYFEVACAFIGSYKSRDLSWGSNMKLPDRAKKYFNGDRHIPAKFDDFHKGCESLSQSCGHDPADTVSVLADHMDQIIEQQDICIDIVSKGVYEGQQITRDRAVVETQAWKLAFTDKGKRLVQEQKWSGRLFEWIEWLADNHAFRFRCDPIPSWDKQDANLRANKDAHAALSHYHSFMTETVELREAMEESAMQAEIEIEAGIDRMRGK